MGDDLAGVLADRNVRVVRGDDAADCTLVTPRRLGDRTEPTVGVYEDPAEASTLLDHGVDRTVHLVGDRDIDAANITAAVRAVRAERPGQSGDDGAFDGAGTDARPPLSNALLRKAIDELTDVFFVFDTDLQFLSWNERFVEVTGYDHAAVRGMSPLEFVPEDEAGAIAAAIADATEEGRATKRAHFLTNDGERIPYEFTGAALTDDAGEVVGICGVGRDITDQQHRERALEQQAEWLGTLNRINEVIRNVNGDLVRADTREAVEEAVVERLVAEDTYRFAWVGRYETTEDRVVPTAWAGEGAGYLEDREAVEFAPDDVTATTVARSGEMRVAQHVTDEPLGSWGKTAREYGFASAAAVPLAHREATYGVLCVYADREEAFGETERAVLAELGETVAYAIGATERRRALLADTLVELEFTLGEAAPAAGLETAASTVAFRGAVVTEDGPAQFYRLEGDVEDVLTTVRDRGATFSVVKRDEGGVVIRVTDEVGVSALIADFGGTVRRIDVGEDGARLVATFPRDVDVRQVLDTLDEHAPSVELLARRERARSDVEGPDPAESLTDRQRSVLATAYHLGFFETPRVSTGTDVAAELDIAPATFHEHLRIAERKLVAAYLSGTPAGRRF
ncbi:bacterio-opsin activator domain-containing protein [Halomarina oriensis]|uniref:bacterio-opsin activator domain-containing protein n=1 Tax=Halomarina oriensis TaxID=671145 RepID=UPI0013030BB0